MLIISTVMFHDFRKFSRSKMIFGSFFSTSSSKKVLIFLSIVSLVVANDRSDIESLINKHWESWNSNKYKDYISTVHSGGTMNGDSNGSFWYEMVPTVKGLTENRKPGDKSNFHARYLEIDVLVPGKAAVAYYYLVGSYTIRGVTKSD